MKRIVFTILLCFLGGALFSQGLNPPGLLSPIDSTLVCDLTPLMEWNEIPGASSYDIQISTSTNIVVNVEGLTYPNYQVLPGVLVNSNMYYWKVNATTSWGKSNWSAIKMFVTGEPVSPVPMLSYPPNGTNHIPMNPSFYWVSNPVANKYRLQISRAPNFDNKIFDSLFTPGSILPDGVLNRNSTYYWRVAGRNNCGIQSQWSATWNFVTNDHIPQPPVLVYPENNSYANTSVNLDWNDIPYINSYDLQLSTDSLFKYILYDTSNIPQSSKMLNISMGKYYWRVRALNEYGNGPWSPIWSFSTRHSISGSVRYDDDNNNPITSGIVKAFKLDKFTGNIIMVDSAYLNTDGRYMLTKIPQDTVDIGVFPNSSPPTDWVITYYPSTIYWQEAVPIYPTENLTDINITAIRMQGTTTGNSISGRISGLSGVSLINLKDVVIYAKNEDTFVKCAISGDDGVYKLQSLPVGNIRLIANRFGYTGDSVDINITSTSILDSVNFHLHRLHTGIKQVGSTTPSEYKLFQNYPNPFNPSTNIKFQIAKEGYVKLHVFDILGREIAMLVNEKLKAGIYEIPFNMNQGLGNSLTSGVYFYKLQVDGINFSSGSYVETRKMLYIK